MGGTVDDLLSQLFYDTTHPAGYSGVQRLYNAARKIHNTITLKQVKAWLKSQRTYTLHKPIRRKFRRRKTIVAGIDQQWQVDLADLQSLQSHNDQFRYLMCVIDVFSKYAWVLPIRDKTGHTLTQSLKSVLKSSGRKPLAIQSDKGSEFKNKVVQTFLKKSNIHFFTTENPETKASIVERFQRTLKTRMWKYFTHNRTSRYIDVLQDLVDGYNHSFHRSIQRTPASVSLDNEAEVSKHLYGKSHPIQKNTLKVGDVVRINKTKLTFEKGYLPNWTKELFKITRVKHTSPPTYTLEDMGGERIEGTFYPQEIQSIKDDDKYMIDSVLNRRSRRVGNKTVREIKVHWEGYPKKFDSWIPETDLV